MSTAEGIAQSNDYQYEKSGIINTVYSFFNTYNYTNQEVASSYALPFTPLIFKPRLNDVQLFLSRKKILWDFGDGTSSESVTARHAYKEPGRYKVTCYLYDRNGQSYYDSFAQNVDIYNFIPNSITLSYPLTSKPTNIIISSGEVLGFDLPSSTPGSLLSNDKPFLTGGKISAPITINRGTSFHAYERGKPNLTIIPYASGSIEKTNYFETGVVNKYYGHLFPYSSFYLKLTSTNNNTEYIEVSSFETSSTPLFCRLENNEVIFCSRSDRGSFFCGTTGTQDVYFKSDFTALDLNLLFGLQPGSLYKSTNTTTIGVNTCVFDNTDLDHLSITSNGLDGEGDTTTIFKINKNKFANTEISFVIKVKDKENFTIKSLPLLTNVDLVLTDGNVVYDAVFKSTIDTIPELTYGGVYVGTVLYDTATTCENVFISAGVTINDKRLTGISNTFNIYPDDVYRIAKIGEDIDFTQAFKDISFQPLFLNNPVLYDEFLKSIFGNLSSEQTCVGKVTHEKIKNFVINNSCFDYANIDKLIALFEQHNLTDVRFDSLNYRYPAAVSRLVDILSINHSRLFGAENKFTEDFKSYGYYNSQIYGKNLGPEITLQQTVTAGNDIVTFERFSGTFKLVNSFLPTSAISPQSKTYQIKDYTDSWGWGLVLPEDGYGENISNYYFFYEHNPSFEGSIENNIINFADPNTSLMFVNSSYTAWSETDGIIANMLANQLYKGLDLIK